VQSSFCLWRFEVVEFRPSLLAYDPASTFNNTLMIRVTGQLADTPTRGLPTRGLVNSHTNLLADWTSRGLDNSWSRRCRQKNEN